MQMMKTLQEESQEEVEQLRVMNHELGEAQMKQLNDKQEATLEAKVLHVNTHVLKERALMQREDAVAFVRRELHSVWRSELKDLQTAHKKEVSQQISIAKLAYERKYSEIVSNLEAEYAEATSKAKDNKASRKRSGGK